MFPIHFHKINLKIFSILFWWLRQVLSVGLNVKYIDRVILTFGIFIYLIYLWHFLSFVNLISVHRQLSYGDGGPALVRCGGGGVLCPRRRHLYLLHFRGHVTVPMCGGDHGGG